MMLMHNILLQIDTAGVKVGGSVESIWSLLTKGGPLMVPLGILFALVIKTIARVFY